MPGTTAPRALVVDDAPENRMLVSALLLQQGFDVAQAEDGEAAVKAASLNPLDLIVLDLGLPDLDGIKVISELRHWSEVPVIVLSARSDGAEKIAALDLGADDHVTKPFIMGELLARMRAIVRRSDSDSGLNANPIVETEDFRIDLGARKVISAGGEEVHLTPTEWGILEILVRDRGILVSQRRLLTEVWGPAYRTETLVLPHRRLPEDRRGTCTTPPACHERKIIRRVAR
jgi:two-component system, OmpR family, KDP operon response regulator KdpE